MRLLMCRDYKVNEKENPLNCRKNTQKNCSKLLKICISKFERKLFYTGIWIITNSGSNFCPSLSKKKYH